MSDQNLEVHIRFVSLGLLGQRVAAPQIELQSGTYKKELSTGLGGDREGNMIAFAAEAMILLRDVIKGDAKL
ncbi:hypothetical protein D0Z07_0931 [Hyphodiscus hymeniophilus]|uniref:Uncharacterized protein n=1 Tax=Hyphodiscus hymeniophilus TaxID=353542 RepID=A0A9P7B0Q8_9HELO|nr:hypothetical protein D0Z07_0931 [Hyphodiscus hymeniophilus]